MFAWLRKMILPIIIVALSTFVAMIVLQWGLDLSRTGQGVQANLAGIVNGEEVSWQEFSQTYSNLLQNERANRGADYEIPDDRVRQLEQTAWDQLVADRLLKQEQRRLKVVVTEEDIYQYLKYSPPDFIQQAPELQTNGQFDYQKYLGLMQDPQAAGLWNSLMPMVRDELQRTKVQMLVRETAQVTEAEVRQAFMDRREKITVGAVNAQMTQFASIVEDPTDEELQAYYDSHKDDYPVDERVILEIVKFAKAPSQNDSAAAEARIFMVYDSVTTGSDFEEFARIYSDDPGSGAAGGDLGWFAPGRMVAEFDSACFVMEEGDISPPIKTAFGWHVLKHHGYRQTDSIREAHASHILVRPEVSAETLEEGWKTLETIRSQAEEVGFDLAAEGGGLEIYTTGPIAEDGTVSYLGTGGPVLEWAFANEIGAVSDVMDLANGYCVLRIGSRVPAGTAGFDEIQNDLKRDSRNEQLAQICRDTIQLVYDEIHRGTSVANAADKFSLAYEVMTPFSRDGAVAKLGTDPTVIGTAFSLGEIGAISKPMDYATGTVILELVSMESPELTEYNEVRDSVYDALLNSKQNQAFSAWFALLKENADVQSNVNFQRRR